LSSQVIRYDETEILRAISHTDLVHGILKSGQAALLGMPLTLALYAVEVLAICQRLSALTQSCLVTQGNYGRVETQLPGDFAQRATGLMPTMAGVVADSLTWLPNTGQGMVAASRAGKIMELAPTTLGDLVGNLSRLQSEAPGSIRVEQIAGEGPRQFVAYLPGMTMGTVANNRDPFNLTSGIYALAGSGASDAEAAATAALRKAGIGAKAGDRVTLVGYSEGALVAANLAAKGDFKVSGVVSIGGQVGNVAVPKSVPVLSIEHSLDIPAKLDLKDNPNGKNWLSVTLPSANPFNAHDIANYLTSAKHVDSAGYAAVASKLQEMLPSTPQTVTGNLYRTQLIG
jgi:hypothetical protein